MELTARLQSILGDAYRIERELGGGGMSRVFVADEVRLGRRVVIKVLPPEMAAGVSVERFEREIQLAAKLQHPHVVPLLTAGAAGDLLYYIMPLIEGESLRAKLAHDRELPIGETVRILREVTDALAHAHRQGIVHRDIKPDNVLLSGKHALVTDFGVAKAVAESTGRNTLTSMGVALGTPAYMAPEQAAADPNTDHRADIYAVGALAYEMLTGRQPFIGTSPQAVLAAQVTQAPEPVTQHRATVPPALAALVMRCLEKKPADRFQSADEVHAQLEVMVTPSGGMAPTGAQVISSGTEAAVARAHPLRVAGLYGLAAIGALAVVYVLVQQLGLPMWVFAAAIGLLLAGLPIMLVTGWVERRRALARTTGRVLTAPGGWHGWLTWRRAMLGGVAAFGALGLGTAVYMAMRVLGIGPVGTLVASGVLSKQDVLLVADFENRTADSALAASVTEAFRIDLAQSPLVRLMEGTSVVQALQRMQRDPDAPLDPALARDIAQREGAKAVVTGEIAPLGRGYVLSARLVSAADGETLVALREGADDDGALIAAVDRLSKQMRERIGEPLKRLRAAEPLEQVTTRSLEALRKYSEAFRLADRAEYARSARLLEEAIALDSGFAMAWRKLAAVLSNIGGQNARVVDVTTRAYQLRDRLPARERDHAVAYYYWNVDYQPDRVIDTYRSLLESYPDDETALNNLALELNDRRRYAEAEPYALRAIATGDGVPFYANAVRAQVAQGKFAAAETTVARLGRRLAGTPPAFGLAATFAAAQGDYATADALFDSIARTQAGSPEWQANAAWERANVARATGRIARADELVRATMAANEQRELYSFYLGAAVTLGWQEATYRNDPAEGLRIVEAALERHPLATMPAADRPYRALVWFYLDAGRPDLARQTLAAFQADVPELQRRGDAFSHFGPGLIALAEGRGSDAVTAFRAGRDLDGCELCMLHELGQAYEAAGEPDSALAAYEQAANGPAFGRLGQTSFTLPRTYQRLGELYEERGERAKSFEYYNRFLDLWQNADPALQPLVRDVRGRVARLAQER
jgi:tetratricopeptide (TPR) repeat protein